jgi:hypothetical protein
LASTTNTVAAPQRAAHVPSPRVDGRVRDDLRSAPANALRSSFADASDQRSADSRVGHASFDLTRIPRTSFGEPSGTLPFLAQQLAQEDTATAAPGSDTSVATSVRMSALRAYGAANDSNIEFLSPMPLYDVRV